MVKGCKAACRAACRFPVTMLVSTGQEEGEAADGLDILLTADSPDTLQFTYHSNTDLISVLKKTEEQCSGIARTYSIGRSMEGRELLVIEFSNNPGEHELRKSGSSVFIRSAFFSLTNVGKT